MSQSDSGEKAAAPTDWFPLLFVMPFPLLVAGALVFGATITVCGISGCTGAGYGVSLDVGGAVLQLVLAILVLAVPCASVRWHSRVRFRWGLSFLAATVLVGVAFYALLVIGGSIS